jgi:elongation factor 2
MGGAIREVQSRRGQILEMKQEQDMTIVEAKCPVADLFGFASSIRSATEGRALWSTEHAGFERVPGELQDKLINEIRRRKGI